MIDSVAQKANSRDRVAFVCLRWRYCSILVVGNVRLDAIRLDKEMRIDYGLSRAVRTL